MAVVLPDEFPILWASVNETGQPLISTYGSTHMRSDHELGIWLRTEGRGFLSRTGKDAKVFGWFRNTATNIACQIGGEAHRVDDPAVRDRICNESPEAERKMDEVKAGVAVIVSVMQRGQVTPPATNGIPKTGSRDP
ncbi:MAG: hypothetical protein EXR68_05330 [Dehalococcoidia bacterium]|nr:hypothetical protein [Dehalococcoidia bacterium]